jgi:hypothetical protein
VAEAGSTSRSSCRSLGGRDRACGRRVVTMLRRRVPRLSRQGKRLRACHAPARRVGPQNPLSRRPHAPDPRSRRRRQRAPSPRADRGDSRASVAKRIDAFATALHTGLGVEDPPTWVSATRHPSLPLGRGSGDRAGLGDRRPATRERARQRDPRSSPGPSLSPPSYLNGASWTTSGATAGASPWCSGGVPAAGDSIPDEKSPCTAEAFRRDEGYRAPIDPARSGCDSRSERWRRRRGRCRRPRTLGVSPKPP